MERVNKMFKQKRVGILGTGVIAATMAGTLKKMKNVKCYGVASRDEQRARDFAEKFGDFYQKQTWSRMERNQNEENAVCV